MGCSTSKTYHKLPTHLAFKEERDGQCEFEITNGDVSTTFKIIFSNNIPQILLIGRDLFVVLNTVSILRATVGVSLGELVLINVNGIGVSSINTGCWEPVECVADDFNRIFKYVVRCHVMKEKFEKDQLISLFPESTKKLN